MTECADGPQAFYSYSQLAKLSGLSRYQVRRLIKRNGVHVIRSGEKVFVPLAALRAALPWFFDSMEEVRAMRMG